MFLVVWLVCSILWKLGVSVISVCWLLFGLGVLVIVLSVLSVVIVMCIDCGCMFLVCVSVDMVVGLLWLSCSNIDFCEDVRLFGWVCFCSCCISLLIEMWSLLVRLVSGSGLGGDDGVFINLR